MTVPKSRETNAVYMQQDRGAEGLHMLLLLHALIPCLVAYILNLFLYFLALSSLPTSFNILMEMISLAIYMADKLKLSKDMKLLIVKYDWNEVSFVSLCLNLFPSSESQHDSYPDISCFPIHCKINFVNCCMRFIPYL